MSALVSEEEVKDAVLHMLKLRYPLRSGYQHVYNEHLADPATDWAKLHEQLWFAMRGNAPAAVPHGEVRVVFPVSVLTPAL